MRPFEIVEQGPVQIPENRDPLAARTLKRRQMILDEPDPLGIVFRTDPVFGNQDGKLVPPGSHQDAVKTIRRHFPAHLIELTNIPFVMTLLAGLSDQTVAGEPVETDMILGIIVDPEEIERPRLR